jgi:hypothetical protein
LQRYSSRSRVQRSFRTFACILNPLLMQDMPDAIDAAKVVNAIKNAVRRASINAPRAQFAEP